MTRAMAFGTELKMLSEIHSGGFVTGILDNK